MHGMSFLSIFKSHSTKVHLTAAIWSIYTLWMYTKNEYVGKIATVVVLNYEQSVLLP